MKFYLFALILVLTTISNFTFAQEICDNGIDDDGDGLIDLNDTTECMCNGFEIDTNLTSMIPNHSFEDYTSLPSNSGQMTNAVGWTQASNATSDYFNLNGSFGDNELNQILPLPDGDGVVGTYVELLSSNSYIEYVGTCLNSPLLAGVNYELVFDIATVVWTSMQEPSTTCAGVTYPDIEMTVFGTSNCANLPFSGVECPIGQADWQVIGSAVYSPIMNTWSSLTININSSIDINGIAIGGPCVLPQGYYPSNYICNAYMFYDDLELHIAQPTGISIEHFGDVCDNNNVLIAHPDSVAGTYQWFQNGVAIIGETDTVLDISANNLPTGTYTIMQTIDTACASSEIDIVIGEIPLASFNTDINCINTASYFTDNSTINSGSIVSWDWNFGDNNTSTQQNASNVYTTNNSFDVTLIVTSDLGCTDDTTVNIQTILLDIDTSTTNLSCFNSNNGEINLTINSGTAPYNFTWSNGDTSQNINNLEADIYTVTVQDDRGCEFFQDFIITQPAEITISSTIENTSCYNYSNGAINLIVNGGVAPYNYNWDNTSQTSSNITNLSANTYTVTVSDANNCSVTTTYTVSQPTQIQVIPSITNTLCYNTPDGAISLSTSGGTPNYSYHWDNNSTNNEINNLLGGFYSVTITDANNCVLTETYEITSIADPLEINYTSTNNNCFGDNEGSIYTNILGGTPPYSYDWGHNIHDTNITNLYAGVYSLTVNDANNCTVNTEILISEPNKLITSLPNNTKICKNTDILIQSSTQGGTTPYQYYWNTGNVADNITINISDSAIYSITVTDANNCISTAQTKFTTFDLPKLISTTNLDSVCPGNPVIISSIITGGATPYTYTINGDIANTSHIVYPYEVNNYQTQVTDACGNVANSEVEIYTYDIPQVNISSDILQGCPPLTVNFNDGSDINNAIYNWTFGENDNNYSGINNPTHIFEESGIYDIAVEITTKQGCKVQQTITEMIEVFPRPEAMFEATPEVISFINPEVSFINYSTENYNNYWYFGDGNMSNLVNPYHSYSQIGNFEVLLITESENGCLDSAKQQIIVEDEFTIYVPTAFSPDGDGINDSFKAIGHGIDLDNYYIAVYDRWGEIIWESTDLFEEWNGTAKNRKTVQNGTYKWLVVCKDYRGVEYTKSGNVTVIK